MVRCQMLAVQLVGKQGLRVQCDFALDADVILAVRRLEAHVLGNAARRLLVSRLIAAPVEWWVRGEEVAQACATPVNYFAPTFNALKFRDRLHMRQLLHIRHGEQQAGNSSMRPFGHLRSLHPYSRSFGVFLVHGRFLRRRIDIWVRSFCVRGIHSVGPRGYVLAELCVGRRVEGADELQTPVFGTDLGESDITVTTEGTHRFRSFEFGSQRSFAKDSASNSGIEFHRLAEGRSQSVNFGSITQPFPNAAAGNGGNSGG